MQKELLVPHGSKKSNMRMRCSKIQRNAGYMQWKCACIMTMAVMTVDSLVKDPRGSRAMDTDRLTKSSSLTVLHAAMDMKGVTTIGTEKTITVTTIQTLIHLTARLIQDSPLILSRNDMHMGSHDLIPGGTNDNAAHIQVIPAVVKGFIPSRFCPNKTTVAKRTAPMSLNHLRAVAAGHTTPGWLVRKTSFLDGAKRYLSLCAL